MQELVKINSGSYSPKAGFSGKGVHFVGSSSLPPVTEAPHRVTPSYVVGRERLAAGNVVLEMENNVLDCDANSQRELGRQLTLTR